MSRETKGLLDDYGLDQALEPTVRRMGSYKFLEAVARRAYYYANDILPKDSAELMALKEYVCDDKYIAAFGVQEEDLDTYGFAASSYISLEETTSWEKDAKDFMQVYKNLRKVCEAKSRKKQRLDGVWNWMLHGSLGSPLITILLLGLLLLAVLFGWSAIEESVKNFVGL